MNNYHTHTFRCRHARGSDEEFVQAAIAAGFETLGFSDHCPWPYPDGYVSGIRMTPDQLPGYCASLARLREKYAGQIRICIGLECEYSPVLDTAEEELFAAQPLDYRILAQHFLYAESEKHYVGEPTTDEAVLARYVDLCLEALETGRYLYLAHPDLCNFVGDEKIFRRHYLRLCEWMARHNYPAEVNILGLSTNRHYPTERFLHIAAEAGCKGIIGIDAHFPAALLDTLNINRGKGRAAFCELPLIDTLTKPAR